MFFKAFKDATISLTLVTVCSFAASRLDNSLWSSTILAFTSFLAPSSSSLAFWIDYSSRLYRFNLDKRLYKTGSIDSSSLTKLVKSVTLVK